MILPLSSSRGTLRSVLGAGMVSLASSVFGQPSPWRTLFVFGDSDSGAGYVDCNGATAVAYVAQDLGIPFTHSTASNSQGMGLNFAVSGAQTGEGEGNRIKSSFLGWGMQNQTRDFVARVKAKASTAVHRFVANELKREVIAAAAPASPSHAK